MIVYKFPKNREIVLEDDYQATSWVTNERKKDTNSLGRDFQKHGKRLLEKNDIYKM